MFGQCKPLYHESLLKIQKMEILCGFAITTDCSGLIQWNLLARLLFTPSSSTLKSVCLIKTITSQETRWGALLKLKYINRPNDFQMRICALILHHLKSDSPDLHAAVYIPQRRVPCDLLHVSHSLKHVSFIHFRQNNAINAHFLSDAQQFKRWSQFTSFI